MALASTVRAARADAPPSPRETLEAFNTIEQWVRAWAVPSEAVAIDPSGTTAACVTLRLGGKTLGRAVSLDGSGGAVWRAARASWIEADANMPVPRDALRKEAILDLAPRIAIDVQVAGSMVPILGDRHEDAALHLSPGVDGISVRTDNGASALFPGTMLALNFTPELAIRAATGELDLPPVQLGELRAKHGVRTLRFRTTHLAQPDGGEPPAFLHRGGKMVPRTAVTGRGLRAFASDMSEHIMTHAWPGDEPHGMTGDYLPIKNTYDPKIAPPRVQGIAAYALLRFAKTEGIDGGQRAKAEVFARGVLERLTEVTGSEPDPLDDALACAAWLLADAELEASERYAEATGGFRSRAMDVVVSSLTDSGSPSRRSLLACALAVASDDESHRALARRTVLGLYQQTPEGRLVGLMPWLSIASSALTPDGEETLGSLALRSAREDVWAHQLATSDLRTHERDLAGGIVFTRGRSPLPTWHSLRPLATIAGTLTAPGVTSREEFMAHFTRLSASLRFVMQLSVREFETHMYRDDRRSLGGVRSALWDQRVSLDATSLALITVCETLRAAALHASGHASEDGSGDGSP